jgi:hypothetical protein
LNSLNTHRIYYGRSNLQNTDPEIRIDPHAKDYIFCQECEDKLGLLEGEMIDYLNTKLRHPNQVQNFPTTILVPPCGLPFDVLILIHWCYSISTFIKEIEQNINAKIEFYKKQKIVFHSRNIT